MITSLLLCWLLLLVLGAWRSLSLDRLSNRSFLLLLLESRPTVLVVHLLQLVGVILVLLLALELVGELLADLLLLVGVVLLLLVVLWLLLLLLVRRIVLLS